MPKGQYLDIDLTGVTISDSADLPTIVRPKQEKARKEFVCWDGEGTRDSVDPTRQNYSLLGNSKGARIIRENLSTQDCLAFLLMEGAKYPKARHVGFAFDYDVNMILRNLKRSEFKQLHAKGHVKIGQIKVEYIPRKWLTISGPNPLRGLPDEPDRARIQIQDVWGFFQSSFIVAAHSYLDGAEIMDDFAIVEEGKKGRNDFTFDNIAEIERYWETEIRVTEAMINKLADLMEEVDLHINQWYGPGALANYVYKKNLVKAHKDSRPSREITEAARYAYAGGRFEMFRAGHFRGPVWGIDINSAYPDAIRYLPSLSEGRWVTNTRVSKPYLYGVYHCHWDAEKLGIVRVEGNARYTELAMPLFHRTSKGTILFPIETKGWYWGPEVLALLQNYPDAIEKGALVIDKGYEFVDWETLPFTFVEDMYNERAEMKRNKQASEKALKLALNSLYGKMAQRAGYERKLQKDDDGNPIFNTHTYEERLELQPTWHQLEWAGWVTSYARAKIYSVISRIPSRDLVAVETDGIYTTYDPAKLGIEHSKALGEWEVTKLDALIYLQSGFYAKKEEGKWKYKVRGMDKDYLVSDDFIRQAKSMLPNSYWPKLTVPFRRFIGMSYALQKTEDLFSAWHCLWWSGTKELSMDGNKKRAHLPSLCEACQYGLNAYDMSHTMTYDEMGSGCEIQSAMHLIPWLDLGHPEDSAEFWWKALDEQASGLFTTGQGY